MSKKYYENLEKRILTAEEKKSSPTITIRSDEGLFNNT